MNKEFRYKPPIKYLLIGLSSTPVSMIFFLTIGKGELWLSIVCGIFGLSMLGMGVTFLMIFINKFGVGNLKLTENYIEVPGRWKKRRTILFKDTLDIGEFNTYDEVIEIETSEGIHLIEKQWMKAHDFEEVRNYLAGLEQRN